jgi:transcriptional regulator with XRE-family HTH domain
MKIDNDVVKISDVPPLALLDLRAKIATAKNLHPERLRELYTRYCSVLKQIREEKNLSSEELSALSGSSEVFLQGAESRSLEMTDDDLNTLHGIYWELSTGEDHPGDFKRLANERLATPCPEIGSAMREIRERKQLSLKELATLSGVPVDILERAESGTVELTDADPKEVQRVYWGPLGTGSQPSRLQTAPEKNSSRFRWGVSRAALSSSCADRQQVLNLHR